MMDEEQFYESGREFLVKWLGPQAEQVDADTELVESGLLDSVLVLEFLFFLESVRGSEIEPGDATADAISTLRSAYKMVVTS